MCVLYFLDRGGSVCGCMCVYTRIHTHTQHKGYSNVSPGVMTRHLECQKNPDGLNLGICIRVCIQSTHVYVYAGRLDEILD